MNRLRTIVRLYEEQTGIKTIAGLARISRNSVKKYIHKWNTLGMSYEDFQGRSDSELYALFCVRDESKVVNPRLETLEKLLPDICKSLSKKGMTTLQLWTKYKREYPDGYGLTQFRMSIQHYRRISNPSMRMEHKAGDKLFIDYTGDKL